jgi:hypothetical protein
MADLTKIDDRGGAHVDQAERRHQRTGTDVGRREGRSQGGLNIAIVIWVQHSIRHDAAQNALIRVAVCINESGDHDGIRGVDHRNRVVGCRDIGPHLTDLTVLNENVGLRESPSWPSSVSTTPPLIRIRRSPSSLFNSAAPASCTLTASGNISAASAPAAKVAPDLRASRREAMRTPRLRMEVLLEAVCAARVSLVGSGITSSWNSARQYSRPGLGPGRPDRAMHMQVWPVPSRRERKQRRKAFAKKRRDGR